MAQQNIYDDDVFFEGYRKLRENNPDIDRHIFRSIHAVHLDTFPGYKTDGELHSFLEKFDREEKNDGEENG